MVLSVALNGDEHQAAFGALVGGLLPGVLAVPGLR